ncbi:hypothetical protein HHK36_004185 [Tetracentron sinense]|uniref:Uncharacterized protein n=1 Tax=Tetracentron sinense TaxID=13715 RepID=A0A834ZSE7_TETSI|nr:hypothetical protein HHK36_004185 [Tetracentron sinense]
MALGEGEGSDGLLKAQAHVWNHILNFINSMSLKCAIQLGIPDIIHHHGRPITLSELVAALSLPSSKTDYVGRLMRILVHSGIFAGQTNNENLEYSYILTPSSKFLLKDHPANMSPLVLSILDPILLMPWHVLSSCFGQDEPTSFEMIHDASFWDIVGRHTEIGNNFNVGMANDSHFVMTLVVREYEVFQGLNSLVDVGGGTGAATKMIAEAFPRIKCTSYDLPHVVATLAESAIVDSMGGDMFESIPHADAVFLKWILHDWGDEDCVKILRLCKEAIPSREEGGKVIIVDMVVKENMGDQELRETQLFFDMLMMVDFGGKERNEHEWQKIFQDAGFTQYKIQPVLGARSIIELYP